MTIPNFQSIMRPLLGHLGDGQLHGTAETLAGLGEHFDLSETELDELLPSGVQTVFKNRVAWAKSYLKQAALVEAPIRGKYQITERGREAFATDEIINMKFLERYEEYQAFRKRSRQTQDDSSGAVAEEKTPEELVEVGHKRIKQELASELVDRIKACPSEFFEKLVVELLLKMGYGGSRKDAGEAVGRGADGGIDGIIKEDRLGLDTIYIQAKKWENTVGRPEVQKFAGALQGRRARKGIFMTTSEFSREAREYVTNIDTQIVLLDGRDLADLMIDFNLGVSLKSQYDIKEIDGDYFEVD